LEKVIEVLLRKEELGATFATTQFFFDVDKWQQLVERLRKAGSKLPIIAGILPITNLKQLARMVELSGVQIPEQILNRFKNQAEDLNAVKDIGIDIATEMGRTLIEMNVPGIHFYTMNTAESTIKIARNLGLAK
jgi:methylenetetrahydrofolate reductase (NADPH)